MAWTTNDEAGYGFTSGTPWLPMPREWGARSVEAQERDSASTLHLYKQALGLRRSRPAFSDPTFRWVDAPDGCLAFVKGSRDAVACAVNMGEHHEDLRVGNHILLASSSDVSMAGGRVKLPPSTAACARHRYRLISGPA